MGWVGVLSVAGDGARAVAREAIEAAGGTAREGATQEAGGSGRVPADAMRADVVIVDSIAACRLAAGGDGVVVFVGAAGEAERLAAWDAGADGVMSAGAGARETAAQLRALMRRRGPRVPMPRDGRLAVDGGSRVARVDGGEVALTRTEFDLLLTMSGRPGEVWRRDALVEAVWGDRWATDRHVLEVHVGNLRRKLAAAGGGSWIRTVRGVGYRLDEPG